MMSASSVDFSRDILWFTWRMLKSFVLLHVLNRDTAKQTTCLSRRTHFKNSFHKSVAYCVPVVVSHGVTRLSLGSLVSSTMDSALMSRLTRLMTLTSISVLKVLLLLSALI